MANRWGKKWKQWQIIILGGSKITADGDDDCSHEIKRCLLLGRKAMTNLDSILKSRDITLPTNVCVQLFETPWTAACKASLSFTISHKGPFSQSYSFSNSHVWMWELDHKESWALKNWCFWIVLEKTPESPLDCKEIKPVNSKGNQSWIYVGRTDAEAPTLWPPDGQSWLIGKGSEAG